ncbi:MAG: DeoR/GlpR family DNA-binding transcription regulator [Lentisphaerae bacterium]|nr:DeoR/GlpR family DNA-binding transcription regulator [Lentisphaerota bacterium]
MKTDPASIRKAGASVRRQRILEALAGKAEVGVSELVARCRVTDMTIRRDLAQLEQQGRLTRTHGGAMLAAPAMVAFAFQRRQQVHLAEKTAIAREAARLIQPGMTVILDTGTTTLEVARHLGGVPGLKVLTSSLAIASALLAHPDLELVLLGGTVSAHSPDLTGLLTEDNLASFRADLAVIGADAADARGLYTSSQPIARVSRAMIANAARTVLVADSSKFGKTAFTRFAGWRQIHQLVTDDGLPAVARRWIPKATRCRLVKSGARGGRA